MISDFFQQHLEALATHISKEAFRPIRDSHDYSSSAYSGFDDGFNCGGDEAMEKLIETFCASLRECQECGENLPHNPDDYKCIKCRVEHGMEDE